MGCPLPNLATNLGILTPDELSQLYSLCDVTISLSGTNLSLLAREVQACGGVVLDLMGDNTRQELTHMEDAWLCEPNVESVFAALDAMISNQDELAKLRTKVMGRIETQPSWTMS